MKRGTAIIVAIVGVIIGVIYFASKDHQRTVQHQEADERRQAQAEAVSVLPAGVEQAWTAYVDRRFAETIQRQGGVVKVNVVGDGLGQETTIFVSRNSPYRIDCPRNPTLGLSIDFGGVDDAGLALLYGHFAHGDFVFSAKAHKENPPPLLVDARSVAAAGLSVVLCRRIAADIQEIMARPDDGRMEGRAVGARPAAGPS